MNTNQIAQMAFYLVLLLALAVPLGRYMAGIMEGTSWVVRRFGRALEDRVFRLAGIHPQAEMNWRHYAVAVVAFNGLGVLALYLLLRMQGLFALSGPEFSAPSAATAFNIAVSFVTNTNWQNYAGESSMTYLTQMLGLTVQNFLSAATGIAVVFALIRGFTRHSAQTIGNFWVDLTRITLYILLPLALIVSVLFMSQGVLQNFSAYRAVSTLQGTTQTLAMGPVASQEAIKLIGTNGGGFFNANSAHPYENPTPLSNLIQTLSILLIPASLCFSFGRIVGDRRQGWALFAAMALALSVATLAEVAAEQAGNPILTTLGADQTMQASQPGGNMEGKETRFGITQTGIFTVVTTAASCGAVNAMHDSLTPLGGLIPLLLMQLGEVIFGGVGSGLYGMLIFALLAVFIAGLMIGRTPEYLGKKIEVYEMKMVAIIVLLTPFLVLLGTALAVSVGAGVAAIANPGPHGLSEVLYAFSSAANNNGSAFAGLSVNTPFYNLTTALAMWFGRFAAIIPVLALAGALAAKKRMAASAGTMPTHGPLFVLLLLSTVLLVGALTYIPALALGPIVEHLIMMSYR
ncbi:K+-transporting ATPase, KdpA [Mycoavidus cysteinexigens]|uniref:Potassium-transporting ATPase potassium-binding subunit n=1 Tax=Mycoavidus cysteinexigens TaxID=1553431 RepID=A0A2Z6EUF5_9BURK|nr:potassium-transporting ATPase subunit KdpA [Mycoavidus cysteinexigens]BBE09052.1 K+-transporting ATPase, KdpA [Mycoavidus cysteinexigens]GAM52214.1 potassium-transporting ATPase A chain [bacterium endosymbiont of Mortierella elongata FMR23-6]GLR00282.1 potassium-transporting ATPase potassium-binding subunit [Mycoavidus cysteinexigens]